MSRSILITGAAKGIGFAIASAAAEAGYSVGLLDADEAAVTEAAEAIQGSMPMVANVSDRESVSLAVSMFGTPDTLVNNAGIVRFGPLIDNDVSDFTDTVSVNLIGCYVVAREVARRMREDGNGGHIINITSINSKTPGPNAGAYPSTKAAVKQLTRQLAIELGPLNIRVNSISPGFIDAGMSTPIYADEKVRSQRASAVPLGRLGSAGDIAKAVLFLDSEDSQYINGHELVIDGGVVHSLLNQLPRD